MFREEPRARAFLLAYAQSSIGTYAGATALVVVAYERLHSQWAITLILLADFVPGMLLGPLLGAMADRWSRRACAIGADVARALAFFGIAAIHSFWAAVALALVAGVGEALFSPAALSSVPELVEADRVPAATALYGAVSDIGRTLGPLIAAASFALISANGLMIANAVTFAISALILARTPFGHSRARHERSSLLREAREGVSATARVPVVRVILWATSAVILFAAMMNVAELLYARKLGAGAAGYGVMVTVFGCGQILGSASGGASSGSQRQRSRYLGGMLVVGVTLLALSVAPSFAVTVPLFAAAGFANGLVVVNQRLLFQALMPAAMLARAFAALDTLAAWGFVASFLVAGALVGVTGPAGLLAVAGGGCLVVWAIAGPRLRREAPLADAEHDPAVRRARVFSRAAAYVESSTSSDVVDGREASTARTASV